MIYQLIDKLFTERTLTDGEFLALLSLLREAEGPEEQYLFEKADAVRKNVYGTDVFMRGLIEFTNYCRNDCYYCGIRRSNRNAERFRLKREQVLDCCRTGYRLGFRTFVLQGGEDPYYNDDRIIEIVTSIREEFPDCAITLSIGEKDRESYQKYFDAGADRYLLRHETADPCHYARLHPEELSAENRKRCLWDLKEIGFQTGCGIMVGSPGQTDEHILKDLRFIEELKPHMIGIGPFIPHQDTPFSDEPGGRARDTVHLLAILRLMLPEVLLPATTALGTIDPLGREKGIRAGANVVMLNLSPSDVRGKYLLYDGKLSTGSEAAESVSEIRTRIEEIGYRLVSSRGDHISRT